MSSSNFASGGSSQGAEVPHVLTSEEKAALLERFASLPSPEEMKQMHQQLLDGYRKIIKLCETLLDEKHS